MKTDVKLLNELSDSQKKTLTHILACNGKDNSSHIAEQIGVVQSSAYDAIRDLLARNYIKKEQGKGNEHIYRLTTKGLAAAFLLGGTYQQLYDYCKEHDREGLENIESLRKKVIVPEKRDLLVKIAFEYLLERDFLDSDKQMTEAETKVFMAYIAHQGIMHLGEAKSPKEMIDRYGFDKSFLKETVKEYKKQISSFERQLDSL